jgi:hypothetical protein
MIFSVRTGSVLVALAVVLAVLGAGASYSGYNEGLQTLTVTSTKALTVTSTETVASTSAKSFVTTTRSTNWILEGEVINLDAASEHYCGLYNYLSMSLDAGQVHVSYRTDGRFVDFWMLTAADFTRWEAAHSCVETMTMYGVAHKFYSNAFESTVTLASGGDYYIVFMNENKHYPVVVTLDVDAGIQERQFTVTTESIMYSTHQTVYPTQVVAAVVRPAGLGLLFFSGAGLIVVAAIVLVVSRKRGATESSSAPISTTTPAVSPHEPTAGKFCMNCGAPLPSHATFCNKCGSKQ